MTSDAHRQSLRRDIHSGVRWNAVSIWTAQAAQLIVSVVLARLLQPEDYGLIAMAMVFVGFLDTFKTMGFSSIIVQRREVSESLLSCLFFTNLLVSIVLAFLVAIAAPLCARIYQEPRVLSLMIVMGFNIMLTASAVVPSAILTRNMRFGRLAFANIVAVILSGSIAIVLAYNGFGVWALVAGSVLGALIDSVLCHAICLWRPTLQFRWTEVYSVLGFSANVTGYNIFNYFAANADNAIVGAKLGSLSLGFYSMAYGIMLRPLGAVTTVLGNVLFAAMARVRDDGSLFTVTYLRACGAIAFVTFPLMLGLAAIYHPFVEVVLGVKWLAAGPLIAILAPLGAVQSIGETSGRILVVKGKVDWYFRWGVISGLIYVCCFFVGLHWGVVGVALSYLITSCILTVTGLWMAFKVVPQLTLRKLVEELWPYTAISTVMAVLVAGFSRWMELRQVSPGVILIVSVLTGVVSYVAMSFIARPPALSDFLALVPGQLANRLRRSLEH